MIYKKLLLSGLVCGLLSMWCVGAAPKSDEDDDDYGDEPLTQSSESQTSSANMSQADFQVKAQNYLNGIRTLKSGYSQTNPNGSRVSGRFYLMRSGSGYGKMRLEDGNQLIISNGHDLIHTDLKTKETNTYPIGSTPAAFLLESHISFDDYKVTKYSATSDKVSITLVRKGDEESYTLSLVFKTKPFLIISEWVVIDGQGNRTFVKLSGVEIGTHIDSKLFG